MKKLNKIKPLDITTSSQKAVTAYIPPQKYKADNKLKNQRPIAQRLVISHLISSS
ncbi:hypothetical protein [Pontibacillus salipaludis]|uniref:Uncharacterized protein n=1 Tax=Pontibacillus salipaludis TaxID=1697394 RepID=A0ABQ1QFU6_9BACI|nr:hypothetical protein [Pontibacillus salipaludis]GGD23789.1 hypothetical protein GCM10011389_34410 [Pontibacillus salipaludis]